MQEGILVVDDHPLLREGLKAIIQRDERFGVVVEAGDGQEALRLAREKRPGLAIVDITLPGMDGIELTKRLRWTLPNLPILIISVHANIDFIVEAFRAGAAGYMTKESAAENLLRGITVVMEGRRYLDDAVSHEVVKRLTEVPGEGADIGDAAYRTLTPREQEVLRMVAEGLASREIADRLFISPKTVDNHRSNVMRKLGLHSVMDLVQYAAKLGLIDLDSWAG